MNEIDILVNAGLSRAIAEMVVALSTMASALADISSAQEQPPAEPPPAPMPVPTPDIPPPVPVGAAAVHGEVIDGDD